MKIAFYRLIIFIAIIGLSISACAQPNNDTNQGSTTPAEIPTAISTPTISPITTEMSEDSLPEKIPAGITLDFWHPWSGEMANLIEEMVGEFNKTNEWGITVNAEFHSDETVFIDDMNQVIKEGESPELIAAPIYYLRILEENGFALQDLGNLIESPTWGYTKDEIASFLPVFWIADISLSKRLGIPAYRSGYLIFYNLTWARELGFTQSPSDLEDFKNQTCRAGSTYLNDSDLNNNGTGGWVYSYNPYAFYSWLKAFGGGSKAVGNKINTLGRNENVESGTYLYDLFLDNCAWIGRQQQPYEYFANRQALAYSGKMEDILTQERVNELNNSSDQWSVLPYPSNSSKPVMLIDGDSYAITTKDKEKSLAAWIFIRWMLKPENQVKVIEASGTFPLSKTAMDMLNDFKIKHPAWAATLQYLPLAQNAPDDSNWGLTKEVLADISWKLIQYTTKSEDIPVIFMDAQNLLSELTQ
ncbi:MAG: extracellular solute-binding protein [Pelolinea sp.]|nr:extracellular solute-binding protein [Pelolinea sp.]